MYTLQEGSGSKAKLGSAFVLVIIKFLAQESAKVLQ